MARIRVEKGNRRLYLYEGDRVRVFRVALGKSPVGPKEREGDGRTPEGTYYVCTRNERSKYHLSLGLSYPGEGDVDRGLASALIDGLTARGLREALRSGRRPDWNTPLGGFIMIHGGGTDGDWTAGCIALCDGDMDVLFAACPLGTEVIIEP